MNDVVIRVYLVSNYGHPITSLGTPSMYTFTTPVKFRDPIFEGDVNYIP